MRKVQEAATSGKDNANQIQKIALYEDSSSEHFITDRMSNSKGMTRTRGRAFFDTRVSRARLPKRRCPIATNPPSSPLSLSPILKRVHPIAPNTLTAVDVSVFACARAQKATWFFITAYSCDIQCGESYPERFCDVSAYPRRDVQFLQSAELDGLFCHRRRCRLSTSFG